MALKIGDEVVLLAGAGSPASKVNRFGIVIRETSETEQLMIRLSTGATITVHGAHLDDVLPVKTHSSGPVFYKSELTQRD